MSVPVAVVMVDPCFSAYMDKSVITPLKSRRWKVKTLFRNIPYRGAELRQALEEVRIAVIGTEQIDREVLRYSQELKLICCTGGGLDHVDLDEVQARGIAVTHTPTANINAVSEFTIALLADRMRRISESDAEVEKQKWPLLIGRHCRRSTLGIIGLGKIGRLTARKALGMGFRVFAYDPAPMQPDDGVELTTLSLLLAESDAVVVHVPLNESTQGLISRKEFELMTRSPYLINVSRGGVVDEGALMAALDSGLVSGAALDVFEQEPLPEDSPLRSFGTDKLLLTPHVAATTDDALQRVAETVGEQIATYLDQKRPLFCATV